MRRRWCVGEARETHAWWGRNEGGRGECEEEGGGRRAIDLPLKSRRSAALGGACCTHTRKYERVRQRRGWLVWRRGAWAEVMARE